MNHLFQRNYKAIIDRGLIKPDTTDNEFMCKLSEEHNEVIDALSEEMFSSFNPTENKDHTNEEIADCLIVCANWLIHRNVDLQTILTQIAIKNEGRVSK
jgi:NTP pyrophosphatase (non-canonical NTP hydrolase)